MSKKGVKLTAQWQLDAALLSRPVDLTSLVTMSKSDPEAFLSINNQSGGNPEKSNVLGRLVKGLLNETNSKKSDKDTKLDVLSILANVVIGGKGCLHEVRNALGEVSDWFDEYMMNEDPNAQEPELYKAMVLLLARCWEYKLKTEDVLELTQKNRSIALCTVVGLLEDGETYSTELKQRQKPGQGQMGQWEHELVCQRYEKPLLLQICRLLRGFTHPGTYFESSVGEDIALYNVEQFSREIGTLLEITMRSSLVEKLSMALYSCLFEDIDDLPEGKDEFGIPLEEYDHSAIASVNGFLQNLYFYAENTDEYRSHLLSETLLIPRLILPYLDKSVIQATILNTRAEAYADVLEGDRVSEMALHNPQLVKGMAATLRTLIIASFRAPSTEFTVNLLRRLNPTLQILRASAFCRHHDYIFALVCMLNVNMGALDITEHGMKTDLFAREMLKQLSSIYEKMTPEKQASVLQRVTSSRALPVSRDTPSYVAVISVLNGGVGNQLDFDGGASPTHDDKMSSTMAFNLEEQAFQDSRSAAKAAHAERMKSLREADERNKENIDIDSRNDDEAQPKQSAFKIAVSVANSAETSAGHKVSDAKGDKPSEKDGFRLLGDLPSLKPKAGHGKNVKVALSLQYNSESKPDHNFMKSEHKAKVSVNSKPKSDMPEEFLCAINGHVMKEPVKSRNTGIVFEKETIMVWLQNNGSICPITNKELLIEDLHLDTELQTKIKKFNIQKMTQAMVPSGNGDDDLYDF